MALANVMGRALTASKGARSYHVIVESVQKEGVVFHARVRLEMVTVEDELEEKQVAEDDNIRRRHEHDRELVHKQEERQAEEQGYGYEALHFMPQGEALRSEGGELMLGPDEVAHMVGAQDYSHLVPEPIVFEAEAPDIPKQEFDFSMSQLDGTDLKPDRQRLAEDLTLELVA